MIKRIVGLGVATLAVTATTLGMATTSAQAAGNASGGHNGVSARYVVHTASPPRPSGHGGVQATGKKASTPAGEADATVRAWGRGDRGPVTDLARPAVVHTLFRHANPGGPHWRRTGASGAMGTYYYTYRNDATGARLVLGVTNEWIPGATAPAVRTARFS